MELRDLAFFESVATRASYEEAAAEVGRTKPALTKAVRRLEQQIGAKLFDRTGRGKRLTPVGAGFDLFGCIKSNWTDAPGNAFNIDFELCSTYPPVILAPTPVTDDELQEVAKFRSVCPPPPHPRNHRVIKPKLMHNRPLSSYLDHA